MSMQSYVPVSKQSSFDRLLVLLLSLSSLGISAQAGAVDAMPEQERLTAALRQLDSIERLVAPQAEQSLNERARYYFDYARLNADLERIRAGIHGYLSPSRAQPRDASQLFGDYRQATVVPADTGGTP
ncbi:RAQPRD family integrative conjugative element protein [Pseudomonas citronellolis]|uniref:integrative conjugative element protein, RAQPRD family n=2 Tax=Pseudomonas TaxID=286 RepID=UPI003B00F94B